MPDAKTSQDMAKGITVGLFGLAAAIVAEVPGVRLLLRGAAVSGTESAIVQGAISKFQDGKSNSETLKDMAKAFGSGAASFVGGKLGGVAGDMLASYGAAKLEGASNKEAVAAALGALVSNIVLPKSQAEKHSGTVARVFRQNGEKMVQGRDKGASGEGRV